MEVVEFDYCWLLIEIRKQISSIMLSLKYIRLKYNKMYPNRMD